MGFETGHSDVQLAAAVDSQFRSAIDTYLRNIQLLHEHVGHEESIRVGGYSERTLLELIQNAADAASSNHGGRIEVVVAGDTLYCANDGAPFDRAGLDALSHAFLSEKRGDEIGRFGLGFKSTLVLSDTPQIFSRTVSFGFGTEKAARELRRVRRVDGPIPILRTPVLLDPTFEADRDPVLDRLFSWATTVVRLPVLKNRSKIEQQVKGFDARFLLFADGIQEIRLSTDSGHDSVITCVRAEDGLAQLTSADGMVSEWITAHQMHRPSQSARNEVGRAVARDVIKFSLAIPTRPGNSETGEFWSYFPLQDRTTATGIFNAPWAINDDRTTLLSNDYNREILIAASHLFADVVRRVADSSDPAKHLDFLTGRGKEVRGFGDDVLTVNVPIALSQIPCIPDAQGQLALPGELRPLNFNEMLEAQELSNPEVHALWQVSPGTGDDVPHFRCYKDGTRKRRMQIIFGLASNAETIDYTKATTPTVLQQMLLKVPSRHVSEWLNEWAAGSMDGAASSLLFTQHLLPTRLKTVALSARVIPTESGFVGLTHRNEVFLPTSSHAEVSADVEFVKGDFAAIPEVRAFLSKHGFRELDGVAILRARLHQLPEEPGDDDWTELWDSILDVKADQALQEIAKSKRHVLVPVKSGGWADPQTTVSVEGYLGEELAEIEFDAEKCTSLPVAMGLGLITSIKSGYPFELEPHGEDYGLWVIDYLNSRKHVDQAVIESIEYETEPEIGPASLLQVLCDTQSDEEVRARWTEDLLTHSFAESWDVTNIHTDEKFKVPSLQSWAINSFGVVRSTMGIVPVSELIHRSLFALREVFPVALNDFRSLALPMGPEEINPRLLLGFLQNPSRAVALVDDVLLTKLVRAALKHVEVRALRLPARVGRSVELHSAENISLVSTNEEVEFVQDRGQPYLRIDSSDEGSDLERLGCIPFEQGFSFSIEYTGQGAEDRALDMFTGLRESGVSFLIESAMIVRVQTLAKRVETVTGKSDEEFQAIRDGNVLLVRQELDDRAVLNELNKQFNLGLASGDLLHARQITQNHKLERLRGQAAAANTDVDRLEVLFGPDEMREILPDGLWENLEAEKLVTPQTSVAELLLQVYGNDTLKELKSRFERLGFTDIPHAWDGTRASVNWLQRFGFDQRFAGERRPSREPSFVIPEAVSLRPLHDYQERISEALRAVLTTPDGLGRPQKAMLELPTGAGKTRVAAETSLRLLSEGVLGGTILWIAQTDELCEQAVQTFSEIWRGLEATSPLTIGRLWGSNEVSEPSTDCAVVVATDAKLAKIIDRENRQEEYEWLSEPSVVFIDEGHVAGESPRYTKILDWLGVAGRGWSRPLVGLSATPFKGRSVEATESLVNRFGKKRLTAYENDSFTPLVERGVLARIKHEVLDGMSLSLDSEDLKEIDKFKRFSSSVMNRIADDSSRTNRLVDHILNLDKSWPVLVFTPTVLSAQFLAARLNIQGISAAAVSAETGRNERRRAVERFRDGELRVLTNCNVFTAGFDAPKVRALYVAKPTLNPNAYIQMVGRGLRGVANGGTEECLIVDLEDNFDGIHQGSLAFNEFEYLWEERQ